MLLYSCLPCAGLARARHARRDPCRRARGKVLAHASWRRRAALRIAALTMISAAIVCAGQAAGLRRLSQFLPSSSGVPTDQTALAALVRSVSSAVSQATASFAVGPSDRTPQYTVARQGGAAPATQTSGSSWPHSYSGSAPVAASNQQLQQQQSAAGAAWSQQYIPPTQQQSLQAWQLPPEEKPVFYPNPMQLRQPGSVGQENSGAGGSGLSAAPLMRSGTDAGTPPSADPRVQAQGGLAASMMLAAHHMRPQSQQQPGKWLQNRAVSMMWEVL
jgi:hypothetical protein